jgi:hypothetical protein
MLAVEPAATVALFVPPGSLSFPTNLAKPSNSGYSTAVGNQPVRYRPALAQGGSAGSELGELTRMWGVRAGAGKHAVY